MNPLLVTLVWLLLGKESEPKVEPAVWSAEAKTGKIEVLGKVGECAFSATAIHLKTKEAGYLVLESTTNDPATITVSTPRQRKTLTCKAFRLHLTHFAVEIMGPLIDERSE